MIFLLNGLARAAAGDFDPAMLRERQVAALAELGRSNKVIAYELGLGHSTVRVLLARAAGKPGVKTRIGLVKRVRSHLKSAW
ncbi:MAG: LuxR C-terminal-related transcriptional regulator [Fibrobacteria bacterium]